MKKKIEIINVMTPDGMTEVKIYSDTREIVYEKDKDNILFNDPRFKLYSSSQESDNLVSFPTSAGSVYIKENLMNRLLSGEYYSEPE